VSDLFLTFRAILHDPQVYTNPLNFNPDRFIEQGTEIPDPELYAFGFGRRCVTM